MPVIVHVVFFVLKTVEVPQLQYLDKVVDDFFVQFIEVVDVPVIMRVDAPQIQFIADLVDIPARRRYSALNLAVMAAVKAFASFFALLRSSRS